MYEEWAEDRANDNVPVYFFHQKDIHTGLDLDLEGLSDPT